MPGIAANRSDLRRRKPRRRNAVSLRSNAQAIRTSLLASATTAVLQRTTEQRAAATERRVSFWTARAEPLAAPWMMSLRRYLLPRW